MLFNWIWVIFSCHKHTEESKIILLICNYAVKCSQINPKLDSSHLLCFIMINLDQSMDNIILGNFQLIIVHRSKDYI